ncbi:MAG TPA: PilN domain-containing protein [Stellaceae bacterium]|nr:PilN domain-containing protein [Stellaceae bacterium]
MNRDALAGMTGRFRPDAVVRQAFAWWIGELVACVPAAWRQRIAAWHGRSVLAFDASGASFVVGEGVRSPNPGRVGVASRAWDRPVARNGAGDVVVRLPADKALRSVVSLPLAAERNIDQVIGFEFERLTPFKREDVFYSTRIARRDRKARNLQAEITVVQRDAVQNAMRAAQDLGFRAVAIEVAGPDGATPVPCDLLLKAKQPAAHRLLRIAVVATAVAATALAVAAAVTPIVETDAQVRLLTARIAEARRDAEESARLRKAIEAEKANAQVLTARKRNTVPVTEILDELTRLLPDDVWLTELQIDAKEVRIAGFATSAASLLGLLDRSSAFANAAYRSPVTQNSALNREQFDIAAQIREPGR